MTADAAEGSELGAVAPHQASLSAPEGQPDGLTWPRDGVAFPVASPTSRGLSLPRAPLKRPANGDMAGPAKPRSGSETRKRQHVKRVRLDDAELAKLEQRASASGLEIGAFLRASALETAGPRAKSRAPVDRELLARTNADLNRVGNNINQIAAALNSHREPHHLLAPVMDELREVLAMIRRAAGYDSKG